MIDEIYNENYYHFGCGPIPYEEPEAWEKFFGHIADEIVENLHPQTVLDAGCAMGYLVAALRDRGVEAYGIDISNYAISKVREDIRPFCVVGSLSEPIDHTVLPERFDLVTSIEVLEHMSEEDGKKAIASICNMTDHVIFSSSPEDIMEQTHINVQQREYWARIFAREHFFDAIFNRPTYVTSWAVLYKKNEDIESVIGSFERYIRQIEAASCTSEFIGKIYFNFGNGESEDEACSYTFKNGALIQKRVVVPSGCKSIRLDPVEGYGCLLRILNARSDSMQLKIQHTNGLTFQNLLLFETIDPNVYFEEFPQDTHWIEIEAEIVPFDSSAWIKLYDSIDDLLRFSSLKQAEVNESQEEILNIRQEISQLQTLSDTLRDRTTLLENENADLQLELSDTLSELDNVSTQVVSLKQKCDAYWKEIQDYSNLVAYERGETAKLKQDYDAITSSTIWRMTKPLRIFLNWIKKLFIWPTKRALRLILKALISLKHNGLKVTIRKIKAKLSKRSQSSAQVVQTISSSTSVSNDCKIHRSTITGNPIDPIQTVYVDEPVKRLNLVTDTINSDSLLGGVATALIVATEFANKWGCELRIITRKTETNPLNYENIIKLSGIKPAQKVSFYSDYDRFNRDVDYKMEVSSEDVFFATSWWSAMAIAETTIRKRFFYIIQEVETFFYNYGPERVLCEQVMQNPDIDFIINSGYLYDYFKKNDPQVTANGCYFEPAFPSILYRKKTFKKSEKLKLFFYSRPNNPRNLYTVGVEMLQKAVNSGIIDTDEWDIYCVGQNAPIITFSSGVQSKNLGQLSWTEYAQFLADVDLGLCLMYTPHPSYPPFDVACSGGVVLSNKMLNKTSFDMCKNVILADLDEKSFLASFREAVALAKDLQQREKNYKENTIPRDWHNTLADTISYMKGKCENV